MYSLYVGIALTFLFGYFFWVFLISKKVHKKLEKHMKNIKEKL
jgi:hypothetical protein